VKTNRHAEEAVDVTTKDQGRPPEQVTDEATKEGLQLAQEVGDAYRRSAQHFISKIAQVGDIVDVGDMTIGVAAEEAEPLFHLLDGRLQLKEPPEGANAHLEVVVMDRSDGRFIPALHVEVTLSSDSGEVGTFLLPFLWHPTMYHYGANVTIPTPGATYTVDVSVAPPTFHRHDKVNGKRYATPVSARFEGLAIKGGRKA
jgi:hypothetical protein